jgi:hypothetical protein
VGVYREQGLLDGLWVDVLIMEQLPLADRRQGGRPLKKVQMRGGARWPPARRTLCTLMRAGEGANEADGLFRGRPTAPTL